MNGDAENFQAQLENFRSVVVALAGAPFVVALALIVLMAIATATIDRRINRRSYFN